jgi:VacB/RNase II family 3'-5' exoribonuclease
MRHFVDLKVLAYSTMESYGFYPRFPEKVLREVEALPGDERVRRDEASDLRALPWSSIDNPDSMDLDQLEFCERGPGDEIAVKVAIADVDLFVPRGSATDMHAAHNGTSVYTGVETFPLLPDRLSSGISSLLPGQDRVAVVTEYTVLRDGGIRPGGIYRARVINKAKLSYDEVGAWLAGNGPLPGTVRKVEGLEDQVRLQAEAARRLNLHRTAKGALDLETLEPRPVVEGDLVRDLVIEEKNPARSLIEEFMVAANEIMVTYLGNKGYPMIQRVVRVPKYWDRIMQVATRYGETLPPDPDPRALAGFLERRRDADPDHFPDLSLTVVKLMGPGEYVAIIPGEEPVGHFALAVTNYTHATAPNRRYADIVNQRLIKSVLSGKTAPYTRTELEDLGDWLTGRDKSSQKVERFMRKAAAAVLLENRIGTTFKGVVTGVTTHGTFARLLSPPAEGKITKGEAGLSVGQDVLLRLVKTDPLRGHIDFERV